jgi:hypothetical protein
LDINIACISFNNFQESVSIQRGAKAAVAECRTDGWIQFDEGELQQRKNFAERNGTWQMMQLSCPSPPTHLINSPASAATTNIATVRTMDQKLSKSTTRDLNIFIAPYRGNGLNQYFNGVGNGEDFCGESQTLQLFPLRSSSDRNGKETEISVSSMNVNFTPHQFFEFLPLKN